MSQTVKMRFKYENDSTRLYAFDCEDSLAAGVKGKIMAINASLNSSTSGGLDTFFIADSSDTIPYGLVIIDGATMESSEVTPIAITP